MKRILSIDGGGLRGILPATVMVELEKRGCPPVDMVAGNSTGGILATGHACGVKAQNLLDLYTKRGGEIFGSGRLGLIGPKFNRAPLDRILASTLGGAKLSELTGPHLLVASTLIDPRVDAFFFKSWKAKGANLGPGETAQEFDFLCSDVAGATSAAPYYFADKKAENMAGQTFWFVDGGLHTNNPVLAARDEARDLWPGEDLLILSLGTGVHPTPLSGPDAESWGVEWVPHLLDVAMTTTAEKDAHLAHGDPKAKVLRIQAQLPSNLTAMDDPTNIPALETVGVKLVKDNSAAITEFCVSTP